MSALSNSPDWGGMAEWWRGEVSDDPAYEDEVSPLLLELSQPSGRVLDVGCGDGRVMRSLKESACEPFGVDVSSELLGSALEHGPVIRGQLPGLTFLAPDSFDCALVSLVLEHIEDHKMLLVELARVVRRGGTLGLVVNHPIYTAPESAPIQEADGEVLWRPGRYFDHGYTDEPAGESVIRFHHRPLGELISDASAAGWDLTRMVESGVTASQVEKYPPLAQQRHIPRLLGVRWVKR